jgi:hypothetical protein
MGNWEEIVGADVRRLIILPEKIRASSRRLLQMLVCARAGARTSFFSSELEEFYLAVPQHGGQEAEVRIFSPQK